ncbi:replication initiator [Phycicoccus flavus]|uniref:replication initiator n=1 Tax=Phycicoccus flavus TaxID=2502783 RepID=UPI000FEBF725|nr:replication initiator [Phycicoccus flavus]NHA69923.1 replication initiation protein [Phycicoccus flavus]
MPTSAPSLDRFAGYGQDAGLDLPTLDGTAGAGLRARFADGSMDAFADTLAAVHNCARPVRLAGTSTTVDTATGEVLSTFSSTDAPLGVLYRPCGNRRAHACPACSRTYARDTFALIRSGVAGGKTVPATVADNPLLFATFTAPSFGLVHGHRGGTACRPRRRDDRTHCPHGRPHWCTQVHEPGDSRSGAPLCAECYDTASAVIWQWHAPELWRRTTIALRRAVAAHLGITESTLGKHASIQYAKVAEYQDRGLVHFHALIRLDGPAAAGIGAPAPAALDGPALAALVRDVAPTVTVLAEPVDADDTPRVLAWGAQLDVRVVTAGRRVDDPDAALTPGQVAGYLAKYATKDVSGLHAEGQHRHHIAALRASCADLAGRAARHHPEDHDYQRMTRWVHMLAFRGHFGTKSRRYSITLGALRRARTRWQTLAAESRRTGQPIDTRDLERRLLADEDDQTTVVVGSWTYLGTGWRDPAEEALAIAAAARAREYDQWRAEQMVRMPDGNRDD